jgi:hypothetical protein
LVLFLAWSFFVLSILGVLWTAAVIAWPNGITSLDVMGLTYTGRRGALLGFGEALVVSALLPLSRSRMVALRRVGHVGLLAWALLFFGNGLCSFDLGNAALLAALVTLAAVCLCVGLRALWFWTPPATSA